MVKNTELYKLLNIPCTASQDEVKKAFRKKAVELHPDKHNGDKTKEEEFKKINEAYTILSDPEKRKRYDQFGVVDETMTAGMPTDINDILKGMFGMDIGGGGGNGFSFVFMNGDEGGHGMNMNNPHEDIFGSFFGGFPGMRGGGHQRLADIVEIPIDICEIYYGKTKKVEFEMLDLCGKCRGTGAADPSAVIKCLTCNGKGNITQQIGPIFVQTSKCHSCNGAGTTIKNNKICQGCKGQKTVYTKKVFELKVPKGIPVNHEIHMPEKGAYEERIKKNKDLVFKFRYDIKPPYTLEDLDVIYTLSLPIEDLLTGFEKNITLYNEEYLLKSEKYFNPNNSHIIDGMGLQNIKRPNKQGNLIIKFNIEFTESERLKKYNDVLRKILKKTKPDDGDEQPGEKSNKIINL